MMLSLRQERDMLKSPLDRRLLAMNSWVKEKYGPNVWITKAGGIGWTGDIPEFKKFIDNLFKDYFEQEKVKEA